VRQASSPNPIMTDDGNRFIIADCAVFVMTLGAITARKKCSFCIFFVAVQGG
jgi:hypothetical protein